MECSEKVRYLKKGSRFRNNKLLYMYNNAITYISMRIKLHEYKIACVHACARVRACVCTSRHVVTTSLFRAMALHPKYFLQTCRIKKKKFLHIILRPHIAPTSPARHAYVVAGLWVEEGGGAGAGHRPDGAVTRHVADVGDRREEAVQTVDQLAFRRPDAQRLVKRARHQPGQQRTNEPVTSLTTANK